jgi:formylglycine-generating enzyme required for sulfatase activity
MKNNLRKSAGKLPLCLIAIMPTNSFGDDTLIPELVKLNAGHHEYRMAGDFLKDGKPSSAQKIDILFSRSLHMMKYQVSNREYSQCVIDNACSLPFKQRQPRIDNNPVTGVSFIDARNYARWLTQKTGITWRLPSDAEWTYSAGSRFYDDIVYDDTDAPSERALRKYGQIIDLNIKPDPIVKPRGAYGANEHGIYDQSGNVWEWTDTCYQRSNVTPDGRVVNSGNENCSIRVVEGKHRSYMTIFIQDAKSGGCGVGPSPDFLGFRLVRDNPALFSLKQVSNWWTSLTNRY